jgi:ribonuclease HI
MGCNKKRIVAIWTDGSCIYRNNGHGPGGWAYLIQIRKARADNQLGKMTHHYEGSGGYNVTTINEMELTAAVEALQCIRNNPRISIQHHYKVYSDSTYLVDGMNGIGELDDLNNHCPANNQYLWDKLHGLSDGLKIEWIWIKGHAGCHENQYQFAGWKSFNCCHWIAAMSTGIYQQNSG